ncbi:MAG: restriction endonuclease, partial [Spirosomaceae bacterium]|nr:restriction endonuclease [Spirosomataceae bacterium]
REYAFNIKNNYEKLIQTYLVETGRDLNKFKVVHDEDLERIDGTYQIDVYAEFEALGGIIKVLIECKRHKAKIKREVVQLLNDKIRSTGANKGMVFATSGFQSGAVKYANTHGIALIKVIEGKYTYYTKSQDSENFQPPPWADIPKFVGEYKNGKSIAYLQPGYLEPLDEFLFENEKNKS